MKITEKTWIEYISRLSRLHEEAGRKMADYVNRYGTQDTDAIMEYAAALVQKYGEGTAELACQMYDAVAEASGASVPPAEPAATANYTETAKMVNGTKHSPSLLQGGVSRLVKRAGADTTLKNAIRDFLRDNVCTRESLPLSIRGRGSPSPSPVPCRKTLKELCHCLDRHSNARFSSEALQNKAKRGKSAKCNLKFTF